MDVSPQFNVFTLLVIVAIAVAVGLAFVFIAFSSMGGID
jgi:uncharacterized membrane-anchored protein YitT (DUF2179 family)